MDTFSIEIQWVTDCATWTVQKMLGNLDLKENFKKSLTSLKARYNFNAHLCRD